MIGYFLRPSPAARRLEKPCAALRRCAARGTRHGVATVSTDLARSTCRLVSSRFFASGRTRNSSACTPRSARKAGVSPTCSSPAPFPSTSVRSSTTRWTSGMRRRSLSEERLVAVTEQRSRVRDAAGTRHAVRAGWRRARGDRCGRRRGRRRAQPGALPRARGDGPRCQDLPRPGLVAECTPTFPAAAAPSKSIVFIV